ncbi:hypothetical protein MSM1_16605 [Mycobacterium sp. SM1]|uniref:hypothetical protein n=1 Tax=Mycobacterium sp. SM1 TaxID=2816243 RepID=UPI001BCC26F4|nr:hypothetical protein [Mycobacterium sp. SM1]MBS4729895.1 hypothetical protein [Mycobacterium sp. SM1]
MRASGPPKQWSRSDAEKNFDYFVGHLDERIAMLNRLTTRNEGPKLDFTDESVAALNEWFVDRAEPDPDQENWPGGLTADWYSVALDMKAYLGEILRRRKPHLRWELSTRSKKDLSYHRPIIAGFTKVPSKLYTVEYGSGFPLKTWRFPLCGLRLDGRDFFVFDGWQQPG